MAEQNKTSKFDKCTDLMYKRQQSVEIIQQFQKLFIHLLHE